MGLETHSLALIQAWTEKFFPDAHQIRMLELGDQLLIGIRSSNAATGKEYFKSLGYQHVSVDLNGQHGAERLDLTKPEQFSTWHGHFHVITNAGTTEHVQPFAHQHTCFGILHDCASIGGLMIHVVPDALSMVNQGKWRGHCDFYYGQDFFTMLAQKNGYEILHLDIKDQLVRSVLRKSVDQDFMVDKDLFLSKIHNVRSS